MAFRIEEITKHFECKIAFSFTYPIPETCKIYPQNYTIHAKCHANGKKSYLFNRPQDYTDFREKPSLKKESVTKRIYLRFSFSTGFLFLKKKKCCVNLV